ncbi:partner and localizer of BRCA2 [Discoglossus pictus]
MDDPSAKSLTSEEKEKLKEKLALLKKEYKRTFNRLQKSQRAERVKTHVKKTIAEHNLLLSQGSAAPVTSEPSDKATEFSRSESQTSNDRKLSVSFNLQPEILPVGGDSPQCSGSGSSGQDAYVANSGETPGKDNQERTRRSRLRLCRSTKKNCSVESSPIDITVKELNQPPDKVTAICDSGSPVFKKSGQQVKCHKEGTDVEDHNSILGLQIPDVCNDNQRLVDHATGNGNHFSPYNRLSPSDCRSNYDKMAHSPTHLSDFNSMPPKQSEEDSITSINGLNDSPNIEQTERRASCSLMATPHLEHNKAENVSPSSSSVRVEELSVQHKEVSPSAEDNNPLSSCTLVEGLLFPVEYYVRTTRRMSSCQRKVDLDAVIQSHLGSSRRGTRGRQKHRLSEELQSPFLSHSPSDCSAPRSVPTSLSLTPLGHPSGNNKTRSTNRSRRGRGRYSSPIINTPFRGPSSSLKDISMQLEFDGVASPVTGGSQSEKENCEQQTQARMDPLSNQSGTEEPKLTDTLPLDKNQPGHTIYTLRPRNTPSHCTDTVAIALDDIEMDESIQRTVRSTTVGPHLSQHHSLVSAACTPQGLQSSMCHQRIRGRSKDIQYLWASGEVFTNDVCLPTSSPFPALSERLSLRHLAACLDIQDFHLPDDEFGILKLEKLRDANQLEPFVSQPSTERKRRSGRRRQNKEIPTTPSMGSPSTVQTTLEHFFKSTKRDTISKDYSESHMDLGNKEEFTTGNNLPAPMVPPVSSEGVADVEFPKTTSQYTIQPAGTLLPITQQDTEGQKADCKKELFPQAQPAEGGKCDVPTHGTENESDFTDITEFETPRSGSLAADTLNPVNASESVIIGPMTSTQTQNGLHQDIVSFDPSFHLPMEMESSEISSPTSLPPPKELSCSVLFSTSVCSIALETAPESDIGHCTPGFPILGFTPAILSSPCSFRFQTQAAINHQLQPAEVFSEELLQEKEDVDRIDGLYKEESRTAPQTDCERSDVVEQCNKLVFPVGETLQEEYNKHSDQLLPEAQISEADCRAIRLGTLEEDHLRLISEIRDSCGGASLVDLGSVCWEFSDCLQTCIMAASKSAVCLWRPQGAGQWEAAHTWNFAEMPVIQILPLSGAKNIICVALGNLEIREIWALFYCPRGACWEQQVVKRGPTNTALGLSRHRLVSNSGSSSNQVVEILTLSERGRIMEAHTLMSPDDSVLAFSELEGEKDALVGSTVSNNVVIWNSVTGQLLSTIYVGDLCPNSTCLSVASDSGLLFMVLTSPYSSDHEAAGSCIFRLVAANPRSSLCANVMLYSLPEGHNDRYLKGDVKNKSAAAVLSSGSIAFWDLSRSPCCALLPPSSNKQWSLVRWAQSSSQVLTAQEDGAICVYEYSGPCVQAMRKRRC